MKLTFKTGLLRSGLVSPDLKSQWLAQIFVGFNRVSNYYSTEFALSTLDLGPEVRIELAQWLSNEQLADQAFRNVYETFLKRGFQTGEL